MAVLVGLLTITGDIVGQGSVTGRVLTSDSVPIGAAVIRLAGSEGTDTTDGEGWFTIELPSMTASKPAIRSGAIKLSISHGQLRIAVGSGGTAVDIGSYDVGGRLVWSHTGRTSGSVPYVIDIAGMERNGPHAPGHRLLRVVVGARRWMMRYAVVDGREVTLAGYGTIPTGQTVTMVGAAQGPYPGEAAAIRMAAIGFHDTTLTLPHLPDTLDPVLLAYEGSPNVYRYDSVGSVLDAHLLYAPLDLDAHRDSIAGLVAGRADADARADGSIPALPKPPRLVRSVTVSTKESLEAEIAAGGADILLDTDLRGRGTINACGDDYQVRLPAGVWVDGIRPTRAATHGPCARRIRWLGPGGMGHVDAFGGDDQHDTARGQDWVFDGIAFNENNTFSSCIALAHVSRMAVVNSVIRGGPAGAVRGSPFFVWASTDLVIANTTMMGAPDAEGDDWCIRLDPLNGADNHRVVLADVWGASRYRNVYRGDSHTNHSILSTPAMLAEGRSCTFINLHSSGPIKDGLASDGIYLLDVRQVLATVESPPPYPAGFGGEGSGGPQTQLLWRARRLRFHCRETGTMNREILASLESNADQGEDWDYGVESAVFTFDSALDPHAADIQTRIPPPPVIVSAMVGLLPISDPRALPAP
jgi:hypothetical protein